MYPNGNFNYIMQPMFRQPLGGMPQYGGQQQMQPLGGQMGGQRQMQPLGQMPTAPQMPQLPQTASGAVPQQPGQGGGHHDFRHMLPYLAMGLLPMLMGGGGGGIGSTIQSLSPLAFGAGKLGLFK